MKTELNYFIISLSFALLFVCGGQAIALDDVSPLEKSPPVLATETQPNTLPAPGGDQSADKQSNRLPLKTSINEAILLSLENNKEFKVERLTPQISQTHELEEQAAFDSSVSATYTNSRESKETTGGAESIVQSGESTVGLSKTLSTGTEIDLGISSDTSEASSSVRQNKVRGGLSITQSLLNGFGTEVNLANIKQSRLDTLSSRYELQGFAESLVARVEKTCWDFLLAEKKIAIFNDSLKLAEDQLFETRERIKVGKLAAVEVYAAQAEVALRREDLINARSDFALVRLQLQRLLNLPGNAGWDREIDITDPVVVPNVELDADASHVQIALKLRPEINQARLEIRRDELEVVKTKNGLLPVLDLFITLGKSGYAGSFRQAIDDLDGDSHDISGGLSFQFPISNRAAKARHKRATLTRQQAEEALDNLAQLIEVDVRSAIIEVKRTKEQISATAATRRLQKESLDGETEKFRVGKSTALLVARTQRDFIFSQIAEVEAIVKHLEALTELYRLEGSLLERRGITVPGGRLGSFPFSD